MLGAAYWTISAPGVVHHIIFGQRSGSRLPLNVCSSPKAIDLLRGNEMT
jgi:hypothetical protein